MSERVENEDGTFSWKSKPTSSIVSLSNNSIIIGEPGSGKTTLFKTLSKEIIEQNSLRNDTEFYPIIISFQDLRDTQFNLENSIIQYFQKDWNKDLNINGKKVLEDKCCVIFIDALDELPQKEQKESALKTINDFYSKFPEVKIICSSRPSDYLFYNCKELGFKYLEISPVDRKQIEQFLNSYFSDNLLKSQTLLRSLKDTGILEKLPKTPMTIALITILFDEKEVEIPATITDLYRQFVDLLIGKTTSDTTMEIIEIGIKHRLLCFIAKFLHSETKQSILRRDLEKILTEYKVDRGQKFEISIILDDLIENTGLLFENEKGEIQFKHLSFQEYLTAYEIFHHRQEDSEMFVNNFNNLWWQNVAIFYAGMTKDAPKLLQNILEKSVPNSFAELISNTGGLGRLMQALYNTPTEFRMKGVQRSVDNIEKAIQFILETEDSKYDLWKNFSKYGILQIIGGFFTFTHWSITLIEPLKKQFEIEFSKINIDRNEDEQFFYEFKLFLICTILANEEFLSFGEFRKLVEQTKSKDLNLFAILDTYLHKLDKHLSLEDKTDENFKKIERKLVKKRLAIGDISDKVNISLNKTAKKIS